MSIRAILAVSFGSAKKAKTTKPFSLDKKITDQLPARDKFILSVKEVGDTLQITQGDGKTRIEAVFVDGRKVIQKESYNGREPVVIRYNEDGTEIKE